MVDASTAGVILDIDGAMSGTVVSAQGGDTFAEVFEQQDKYDYSAWIKYIGQPQWEDLELQLRLPLHRSVYDWIAASWRREYKPRTVRLTAYDSGLNVIRRREFQGALISETTLPTLETGAPELGLVKLKLRPESARTIPPSGTVPTPRIPGPLLGATFRLDLPGLDCTKVMKIDSFTVKQDFIVRRTETGEVMEPDRLSFPNLAVTLPESLAQTWQEWFSTFVVEQRYSEVKTGKLSLLDGKLQERLRIGLFNVGIFRLRSSVWTREDAPLRVVAGLYCKQMDFTVVL